MRLPESRSAAPAWQELKSGFRVVSDADARRRRDARRWNHRAPAFSGERRRSSTMRIAILLALLAASLGHAAGDACQPHLSREARTRPRPARRLPDRRRGVSQRGRAADAGQDPQSAPRVQDQRPVLGGRGRHHQSQEHRLALGSRDPRFRRRDRDAAALPQLARRNDGEIRAASSRQARRSSRCARARMPSTACRRAAAGRRGTTTTPADSASACSARRG